MTPSRRAPFTHPLASRFDVAVDSLGAALAPESTRQYRSTVRNFLAWLGANHPEVVSLDQLRRDPHVLGWMAALRSRVPPLAPVTYILRLIFLRGVLAELAWTAQRPELAQLLRRQDIPRRPRSLPRALSAEHDRLLQQELQHRNDLGSNFFLLLRHTGMRVGEGVDLACDCLHISGKHHWTIHVPLGKLKTERIVPVDSFTRDLVHRLRFFRWLDPSPPDGRLLARPTSRQMLIRQLPVYLREASAAAGIPGRMVPHPLRHTCASEMLRGGVDLPVLACAPGAIWISGAAVPNWNAWVAAAWNSMGLVAAWLSTRMKLLGHASPEMTMVYLDIALTDLQREFERARAQPRHLVPQPQTQAIPARPGREGVLNALLTAPHAVEMYRRALPDGPPRRCLNRLLNRLPKIASEARKLQ